MKNKILNNWGLKLVSLLFSFMLWLIVINITDPQKEQTYRNIPVKLINTDILTEEGLVYDVLEDSDIIDTVMVYAPRTIIEELDEGDLVAEADLKDLTIANTVPIKVKSSRYNDQITNIKLSADNVQLSIEEKKTLRLVLKLNTIGEAAEGYIVGNSTIDQNLVIVSGPESIVSRIVKASADVDVSGSTSNIATYADVKLYDIDGLEIKEKSLTKNFSSVRVSVEILGTKEVPLVFTVSGEPVNGYMVSGEVASSNETILISGSANILNNIQAIEIPGEVLDVTGQNEDYVAHVDIKEYLPSGTALAQTDFSGVVVVTVPIEKTHSEQIEIIGETVRILNLPEGYKASIKEEKDVMTVVATGLPASLEQLQELQIIGVIDIEQLLEDGILENVQEGVYTVPLMLYLPDGVKIEQPVMVHLILDKLEEEE